MIHDLVLDGEVQPDEMDVRVRNMWAQMLYLAIQDYQDGIKTKNTKSLVFRSANLWLHDDTDRVASFRWVCDVLDIDPARVRAMLETRALWTRLRALARGGKIVAAVDEVEA